MWPAVARRLGQPPVKLAERIELHQHRYAPPAGLNAARSRRRRACWSSSSRRHGSWSFSRAARARLAARARIAGRCGRERSDVKDPRDERDDPSHNKPSRAKQSNGAATRMAQPDRSGEHRGSLLEQETQVRAQRRPQRKGQSQDHRGILALDEKKIDELALGIMEKPDEELGTTERSTIVLIYTLDANHGSSGSSATWASIFCLGWERPLALTNR